MIAAVTGSKAKRRNAPRRRFGWRALLCAAGACLAVSSASAAEDERVVLPLKAPAGADPLVADFIEICSLGVTDVAKGAELALSRGWATGNGEPNDKGFAAGAMAAFGSFGAAKTIGSGSVVLSLNRAPFPHLAATNCLMNTVDTGTEGIDPTVISKIPGVLGGGGVISIALPKAGFWSLVDDKDEVVTMSAIPIAGRGFTLNMSRAVRLDPKTGQPLTTDQVAR